MWYRARAITSDCGRADLSHGCIARTRLAQSFRAHRVAVRGLQPPISLGMSLPRTSPDGSTIASWLKIRLVVVGRSRLLRSRVRRPTVTRSCSPAWPHIFSPLVARSFNPVADFTNIAFIGGSPAVLTVHPSLNVHSLNGLTAMLRKRAEPWRHVSSGVGTPGHLLGEYWAHRRPMA